MGLWGGGASHLGQLSVGVRNAPRPTGVEKLRTEDANMNQIEHADCVVQHLDLFGHKLLVPCSPANIQGGDLNGPATGGWKGGGVSEARE